MYEYVFLVYDKFTHTMTRETNVPFRVLWDRCVPSENNNKTHVRRAIYTYFTRCLLK